MTALCPFQQFHVGPGPRARERGAALVIALVMLLILTILGITAMNTASLEGKMAGNTQEQNQAFQAAESGINSAINTPGFLNPVGTAPTQTFPYVGGRSSASVQSAFTQYTPPSTSKIASETYSKINFQSAHFGISSTGTTITNARSVHQQGIEQIIPKNE